MLTGTATSTDPFEHLLFLPEGGTTRRTKSPPGPPLQRHRETPDVVLDPDMARLYAWLCDRAGVRTEDYRRSVFRRRAGACLRAVRCRSFDEAVALATGDPQQAERLLDAMMVGVTSFFRDPQVFGDLSKRLSRRFSDAQTGRDWRSEPASVRSVGCSNGSELYSCAMLLDALGLLERVRLSGIDCRPAAVRAARSGVFRSEALEGLDPARVAAWFECSAGTCRVREHLRDACSWSVGDAFAESEGIQHDVILCRNLAIYLSPAGMARLWSGLAAQLRPAGLLVVGKAERPPSDLFWKISPCIYERKGIPS